MGLCYRRISLKVSRENVLEEREWPEAFVSYVIPIDADTQNLDGIISILDRYFKTEP